MRLGDFHKAYACQTDPKHGRGIWEDMMRKLHLVHGSPICPCHALKSRRRGMSPAVEKGSSLALGNRKPSPAHVVFRGKNLWPWRQQRRSWFLLVSTLTGTARWRRNIGNAIESVTPPRRGVRRALLGQVASRQHNRACRTPARALYRRHGCPPVSLNPPRPCSWQRFESPHVWRPASG
jgi:hypothetical protein